MKFWLRKKIIIYYAYPFCFKEIKLIFAFQNTVRKNAVIKLINKF